MSVFLQRGEESEVRRLEKGGDGVYQEKKRGSLDSLQLAGNYGYYLGSKCFGGASDVRSRAEGRMRPTWPGEPGLMAAYPKQ